MQNYTRVTTRISTHQIYTFQWILTLTLFREGVKILTYYSGEIFWYFENDECLLLRYWSIDELPRTSEPASEFNYVLLFDDPKTDPRLVTKKMASRTQSIIFEFKGFESYHFLNNFLSQNIKDGRTTFLISNE